MKNNRIHKITALAMACATMAGMSAAAGAQDAVRRDNPAYGFNETAPASLIAAVTVGASVVPAVRIAETGPVEMGYRISFDGSAAVIYRDGQKIVSYGLRGSDVAFDTAAGETVMRFIDQDGKTMEASIGAQTGFVIDGSAASVTFNKTFSKEVAVTFTGDSSVTSLVVHSANPFELAGMAVHAQLNGAAKVNVPAGASIGTLTVGNARARVEAVDDTIGKVNVPSADVVTFKPVETIKADLMDESFEIVEYESLTAEGAESVATWTPYVRLDSAAQ